MAIESAPYSPPEMRFRNIERATNAFDDNATRILSRFHTLQPNGEFKTPPTIVKDEDSGHQYSLVLKKESSLILDGDMTYNTNATHIAISWEEGNLTPIFSITKMIKTRQLARNNSMSNHYTNRTNHMGKEATMEDVVAAINLLQKIDSQLSITPAK